MIVLCIFGIVNSIPTTVSFNAEGGIGGSRKVEVTDEELPNAVAPQKKGYTFGGFFDQRDGKGKQYYSGTMEKLTKVDFKRGKDLYAFWIKDSIKENVLHLSYKLMNNGTYELTKAYRISENIEIPSTYKGKPVSSIGAEAFAFSGVYQVVIPDSVKTINHRAFYYCTNLTSITISSSVKEIGISAFEGCKRLKSMTFPEKVRSLPQAVLKDCLALTAINFEGNMTSIGEWAFKNCKSLTTINLPDGITEIKQETFKDCISLEELSLPIGLTSIKSAAFQNCAKLEQIEIPSKVVSIGDYAFSEVSAQISFAEGSEMTTLDKGSFIKYQGTSFELPESIESIESLAFANCPNLESVTLNSSLVTIEKYAFQNCKSLLGISIPASATQIDEEAFYLCEELLITYEQ